MDADLAEVVSEARLHKGTRGRIERLSRRAQTRLNDLGVRDRFGAGLAFEEGLEDRGSEFGRHAQLRLIEYFLRTLFRRLLVLL